MLHSREIRRHHVSAYLSDLFGGNYVALSARMSSAVPLVTLMLADSPSALWKCQDASGNAVDSSGNSRDMTTTSGTPTYQVTGPHSVDYGIQFNADGMSRTAVNTATNNLSYELWYKINSLVAQSRMVTDNSARTLANTGGTNGYGLFTTSSGDGLFNTCGNVASQSTMLTTFSTGVWYHIVVVRDSGTWKYYVNGELDTQNAGTSTPNAIIGGITKIGTTQATPPDHSIAYCAYYTTVITPASIRARYLAAQT